MAALRDTVIDRTLDKVKVAYLDRATSKWWNQKRNPDDTAVFCGWYWIYRGEEGGPFKTRSSAIRDAYYRFILHRELPSIGNTLFPVGKRRIKLAEHGLSL